MRREVICAVIWLVGLGFYDPDRDDGPNFAFWAILFSFLAGAFFLLSMLV